MADAHKLTAEEQTTLRNMAPEINQVAKTIESLEAIGIDMSEQKARLQTAQQIRDGLLRNFGNPISPR